MGGEVIKEKKGGGGKGGGGGGEGGKKQKVHQNKPWEMLSITKEKGGGH